MAPEPPDPLNSLPDCVELVLDDDEDGDVILEDEDAGFDDVCPCLASCPWLDRCRLPNL